MKCKKHIIVSKCSQCPANSNPLCLADMDLDDKVTEEGFPEGCPLDNYGWISVSDDLPDNSRWVLGKCSITVCMPPVEPVIFQVKYSNGIWSDWCGDGEKEGEWRVTSWSEIPT